MMDQRDRRFLLTGFGALALVFLFSLLQNYIRYSIHESYNVWRSVVYLILCYVLFLPAWWLVHGLLVRFREQRLRYLLLALLLPFSLGSYYLLSGFALHLAGFYDGWIDIAYLRSYAGRHLLFHLVALAASTGYAWYAFRRKPEQKEQKGRSMITATLGRREVSIRADLVKWMEADDHYLRIFTASETYLKRITLEKMREELEPDFIRIHRKYLVRRAAIIGKERQQRDEFVILDDGKRLRVGRSYQPLSW